MVYIQLLLHSVGPPGAVAVDVAGEVLEEEENTEAWGREVAAAGGEGAVEENVAS